MKITTIFTCIFVFATTWVSAQNISEHTLGLRLGDSDGFGAEISYQKSIGRYNRAEFNLGWRDSREFDAFKLAGVYQWVRNIDGGFNWYYGFGGGVGNSDFEAVPDRDRDDGLFVFAAGNLGIEYDFDIPLLISLDMRPEIGLLGFSEFDNDFLFDFAIGLRYQF
ncbi:MULTISPECIES: hypothetical protein [Croceitalea]|uniref:Outer membrane protein beta-barrel domain-containing protein n=1 Tax=Croceitalea vernalis TaxID=3075599 RepID=A0ABU3BHH2_9FLAO|nr:MULTISPECIES: hypothetical protein [unclassified Croceitalea]MDT0539807.1 hypothetical protein [Croceitalea sp. P059]MDT0621623.1 hypothetical protein [Croceitalea sp. P007]